MLTAANTYLGLYAGMTVNGSIPAAIVSMGILRGLLKRGTIHENNIVQTIASAGEAVAAGIIFTVPAMLIAGVWVEFSFWKVSLVGLLGGLLGVLFMIPLRRVLIVEDRELIYPEGVACARVLEAGESGGSPMRTILCALGGGLVFKSMVGLVSVFRGTAEIAWKVAGTVLYAGTDVSVALLGVGVIVGVEIGLAALTGSVIAWVFAIPIFYWQNPLPDQSAMDAAWGLWNSQIRYMGVGAMIVGGLASMWKIRSGIAKAVSHLLGGIGRASEVVARTDKDLPNSVVGAAFGLAALGTFVLYQSVTGSVSVAITAGVIMLTSSLFFVAVSSYICGLVGSSNNPISGTTICALMFSSVILLILGMTGSGGILGALGVASIVCCAAATAGDTSQDLKTGQLVGATPRLQQTGQFIGILVPVFTIAPVLTLLHNAYGIGTGEPNALLAPQATLFASIAEGLFGDSTPMEHGLDRCRGRNRYSSGGRGLGALRWPFSPTHNAGSCRHLPAFVPDGANLPRRLDLATPESFRECQAQGLADRFRAHCRRGHRGHPNRDSQDGAHRCGDSPTLGRQLLAIAGGFGGRDVPDRAVLVQGLGNHIALAPRCS